MNVLILGANGFIGSHIMMMSKQYANLNLIVGSRSGKTHHANVQAIQVDSTNRQSLTNALHNIDTVINCITGSESTITRNAMHLVNTCSTQVKKPRIIHMSSMSVYGKQQGVVSEQSALIDNLNWYGHAKIEAEKLLESHVSHGGELVVLRPGCVNGEGSRLWNTRIETWLKQRKLGDLGAQGDGWSNLVDVKDVAQAALNAVTYPLHNRYAVFNLSSPNAPRWNDYFIDMAVRRHHTPVKRISYRQLQWTSRLGLGFKVVEHLLKKLGIQTSYLPEAIPPSLLTLLANSFFLDGNLVIKQQLITHYQAVE